MFAARAVWSPRTRTHLLRHLLNVGIKSSVVPSCHMSFIGDLGYNIGLLAKEMIEKVKSPDLAILTNRSKTLFEFKELESLESCLVATDQDIGGKSTAQFTLSKNNKGLFHGTLCTEVPRDGETEYSGYCTLKTKQMYRSFNRKIQHDLSPFNMFKMRVRGDGRSYMINLLTESYFSNNKDDMWNYFLFTKGGPYWQDVTIPFSKFFLSHRGRIQDRQAFADLERVNAIAITMADGINGDFALEIDHISVDFDPTHKEEFAYELYERNPRPKQKKR
ncbi:complex I intermediate-associated protein 30, mitochondrial-like [Ptychodera flava]|uniref:complex I intermediate-associated protein 30, mitochondrial-like n=1 Tax=Ptychodera flava TaxID=63121 RepID=UPI00396A995E